MWARLRQVAYHLRPAYSAADAAWAHARLNDAQRALFEGMGLSDRAHAVRVARRLAGREAPAYALEAALLHDCAKPAGYGLFWRSAGVLLSPWLNRVPALPRLSGPLRWLQIYRWHDQYGLELARAAGTSPEALALLDAYMAASDEAAQPWLEPLRACDDLG